MEQFKRILCPVDFSEYSAKSLRYAIAFAQQHHAKLIVCHSLQPVPAAVYAQSSSGWQEWSDNADQRLEALIDSLNTEGVAITTKVESGDPAIRIVRLAEEEKVELIVMGTHGASGYEAFLMGSVTNKVLHKTKIPVLAVCKPTRAVLSGDPNDPLLIGRILCPIDPLDAALPMISKALVLARYHHASITFYAVYQPGQARIVFDELRELIQPERETQCHIEFLESEGDPVEEILKTIRNRDIDLTIMGHHRRMPMAREALGSVTLHVIPGSNCPVLVIQD